jgi:hypothetical protein
MMSSPLALEQLARLRQERYQREAAADRLARQQFARGSLRVHTPLSVTLRLRLSAWLYALAARLSSGTADAARTLDLGCQAIGRHGVEYWPSA